MATLQDALEGISSAAGTLTLAAGTTSTVKNHRGVSPTSHITLVPTNAAAASLDALGWWVEPAKGSFTVHHSSMTSDRTYSYGFVTPMAN
jgi:hypothetical protein